MGNISFHKNIKTSLDEHRYIWLVTGLTTLMAGIILLIGINMDGYTRLILSGIGASFVVSLPIALFISTTFEEPLGVIIAFFGGLFVGTYFAYLTAGVMVAVLASYISPVIGASAGYLISKSVWVEDEIESDFDE